MIKNQIFKNYATVARLSQHFDGSASSDVHTNLLNQLPEVYREDYAKVENMLLEAHPSKAYKNNVISRLLNEKDCESRIRTAIVRFYAERLGCIESVLSEFASGVKSIFTYVISVIVVSVICMGILITKVMPSFEEAFQFGEQFPAFSIFVFGLTHYSYVFFIVFILIVTGIYSLIKMIRRRVHVLEPLPKIMSVAPAGRPLVESYNYYLLLQYLFVQINATGEKVGALATVERALELKAIGDAQLKGFYHALVASINLDVFEKEYSYQSDAVAEILQTELLNFKQLLNVGLTSLLGIFVGGIVIAIYLPIFSLGGSV